MYISYIDKKELFTYLHIADDAPNAANFKLHNHNDFSEILIFLQGNSQFHAEGSVYYLKPNDILVTHSDEMHRMCHNQPTSRYERIIINIHTSFFTKYNCEEFKKIFISRPLGVNNLISGQLATKHHINEITDAIDNILETDENAPEIVIRSKLIELLYNLNKISPTHETTNSHNQQMKAILMYINENITSPLTLDSIAERFYISKYHLCHLFKKHTGFSPNKYITHKRILLVRELFSQGKTLLEASYEAGFLNYSNFYKMYKLETGKSPREDLK